jgi:N-acetylmuramoyl-L-alanine amidase
MAVAILQECQRVTDAFYLGLVLWREARGENYTAKTAVAHVVMTRASKPGWWGHSVVEVITKKWQFSSMTDPKDKQLTFWPQAGNQLWLDCLGIAMDVLDGKIPNPVPGADSYHDISILPPKWGTPENYLGQLGRIKFYKTDGAQGQV